MNDPTPNPGLSFGPVGLDVGYDAIRCVRGEGDRLVVRRQAAAYAVVPDGESRRRLLSAAGVSFTPCGESLLVIGDDCEQTADSFGVPVVPVFPDAAMPADDPVGRQVVAILIESLLGRGHGVCGMSLPGDVDADTELVRFVGNLVTLAGYRPLLAHTAAAAGLVLHESTALSGLTVDFGAARTDIALITRGREAWHASVPRGGASVIQAVAEAAGLTFHDREGHAYHDIVAARDWVIDPERPGPRAGERAARLSCEVDSLLDAVAATLPELVEAARLGRVPSPLPVAMTGGLASLPGLTGRFSDRLRAVDPDGLLTPLANDPRDGLTVARGLLVLADLETPRQAAA